MSDEDKDKRDAEFVDNDENTPGQDEKIISHSFENLMDIVGSFGRWQICVLLISTLSGFISAFNHLGGIFLAYTPDIFYCDESGMNYDLATEQSRCETRNGSLCTKWIYDQTVMTSSVVTTFNLVCQNKAYLHLIQSTYMAGIIVATVIGGFCSDHFGRRATLLGASVLLCISSFGTAFSHDYRLFLAVRFFVGGSAQVMWSSMFVLIMESVSIQKRSFTGIYLNMSWNFGSLLMVGISYAIRDWKEIQIAFSSVALLSVFHLWVCESPRWLLRQKRIREADKSLRKIAAFNGINVEGTEYSVIFQELAQHTVKTMEGDNPNENNSKLSFIQNIIPLMKHHEIRKRFLILSIPFFCIGTSSYGIHFAAKLIPLDIFVVCVYKDLMIAVVASIGFIFFNKMRRIPYLISCFAVTGVIGVTYPFLTYDTLRVIVYGLLQSLGVVSFYFLDIYTPEAFPTNVRSQVFSILDCWSKVGAAFCTMIIDVGTEIHQDFPLVIFGILLLVASIAFIFLPETKGAQLADNYLDLEKTKSLFGKRKRDNTN